MADNIYNEDARQYLQMMQENISRMATNSANAKTWMVTIEAAFLALGCSIEDLHYWLLLALIPILVLWYIDAYYLRFERALRNREQHFINLIMGKEGGDLKEALFDFRPMNLETGSKKLRYVPTKCLLFNKSVYPLYLTLTVIVIVITYLVNA